MRSTAWRLVSPSWPQSLPEGRSTEAPSVRPWGWAHAGGRPGSAVAAGRTSGFTSSVRSSGRRSEPASTACWLAATKHDHEHETRMKAVVQDRYGLDALRLEDIDVPVAAGGAVLVRVQAPGGKPPAVHAARGVPYAARMALCVRGPSPQVPG